ncbi:MULTISPECIES: sulfatase family protein [Polaromonas]|uniref:Sulfatase n=1 Tax=Polaromonas aquatica TaxID=332657 RepID=A0ABW1U502_9BURK
MSPNFLIFVTDQQRADHLGCAGNPVLRTPHIDALAEQGTRFNRAYVNNPVCTPNRGSMLTGRIPSLHGARGNGTPLPLESVTFPALLAEFGYHTALIGKSHLQNMEDTPPALPPTTAVQNLRQSARYPEATTRSIKSSNYEQELRSSWETPDHHLELPYYGFQDVVLCNHHADECFGDYSRWLQREHPSVASRVGREHGVRDPAYVAPQAWHTALTEFQYPTHFIAEQGCEWLREHHANRPDQPFALVCSFPDPHHPWTPPGKYWDMYKPSDITLPPTARPGSVEPGHVRWLQEEREAGRAKLETPRMFASNTREIQEIIALTYGMISNIDDRIGMVMQTLKDCGADANTVVIFTSDHGDLMGDHGLMLKGPIHYQGLVRVPFIWRDPQAPAGEKGGVREDLVSSIDLPASILRRASIAAPNGMQGKALFDVGGTGCSSQRSAVLIEENQQRAYLGFEHPVRVRTLVTATHRLSVFAEGEWGELYDLRSDPDETQNLWDEIDSRPLRESLLLQLIQQVLEHSETSPRPTRLA